MAERVVVQNGIHYRIVLVREPEDKFGQTYRVVESKPLRDDWPSIKAANNFLKEETPKVTAKRVDRTSEVLKTVNVGTN